MSPDGRQKCLWAATRSIDFEEDDDFLRLTMRGVFVETRERFSYLFDDSTWESHLALGQRSSYIVREMEELVKHIINNNNNSIEYN